MSERESWRDKLPEWMRGTTPLMTDEQTAEFNRRAVERMNADDDLAHRIFTRPPVSEGNTNE